MEMKRDDDVRDLGLQLPSMAESQRHRMMQEKYRQARKRRDRRILVLPAVFLTAGASLGAMLNVWIFGTEWDSALRQAAKAPLAGLLLGWLVYISVLNATVKELTWNESRPVSEVLRRLPFAASAWVAATAAIVSAVTAAGVRNNVPTYVVIVACQLVLGLILWATRNVWAANPEPPSIDRP